MVLNVTLGAALLTLPGAADRTLGQSPLLPLLAYRVIGIGFLGFAGWQWTVLRRSSLSAGALLFAALMALIPAVVLGAALLAGFDLRPAWRTILWVGNIYMALLGVWYLYLARLVRGMRRAGRTALEPD
jgi:hypothetical protein